MSSSVQRHDRVSLALQPGTAAPNFTLSTKKNKIVTLSDLRGQVVVLAFYPAGWDPSRADQIAQYNKILSQLPNLNAELLDLSVQGDLYQLAFPQEEVPVQFVKDHELHGKAALLYGVAGREALFVIDTEGIIQWSYVAPVGVSPKAEDLLSALRALSPETVAASKHPLRFSLTRREFIAATLATAFALAIAPHRVIAETITEPADTAEAGSIPVNLSINGVEHTLQIDPRVTLLDALRERIGLTGTKKGCDHGQCGACTVLTEGRRTLSCLTLAISAQDKQITTIEGLAQGEELHPMQAAFLSHDGFQCGYCTPGQIMSAVGLLGEPCGPTDADVRELMSGNICRCGAYPNIVDAVQEVRKAGKNAPI
jgi:xanthine dehydrogenase YagT iron-sulfur-binding subunit